MKERISIIIGAYNAHFTLPNLLYTIKEQDCRENLDIIIVDDCSDKPYDDIIKEYESVLNISLYRLPENHGIGYAKQYGIEQNKNDYIVFADADDEFFSNRSIDYLFYPFTKNPECLISIGQTLVNDEAKTFNISLWSRMYKATIFRDTPIPDVRYNEDKLFDMYIQCLYKDKLAFINKIVYWYKEPTLTKKYNLYKKKECFFNQFIPVINNILKINDTDDVKKILNKECEFLKETLEESEFLKVITEAENILK